MILDTQWETYRKMCIASEATEDQLEQLKQAFYAGAAVVDEANNLIGEDTVTEEQGVQLLQEIHDCILNYYKSRMKAIVEESKKSN